MHSLSGTRNIQSMAFPISLTYTIGLDGLRGLAVIAVLCVHLQPSPLPGGFIGVDVFFVLSGFLITMTLLKEWHNTGTIRLANFYVRRMLRLIPALAICVFIYGSFSLLFTSRENIRAVFRSFPPVLLYYNNWMLALGFPLRSSSFAHTWSLSVEEHFYLVWPVLMIVFLKLISRPKLLIWLAMGGIVMSAGLRGYLLQTGFPVNRLYCGSDVRADGLLTGCLLGLLTAQGWPVISGGSLITLRLAKLAALFVLGWYLVYGNIVSHALYRFGLSLVSLSTGVLLIVLVRLPSDCLTRTLSFQPLAWLGKISYGLYVWHWPVYTTLEKVPVPTALKIFLQISCSVVMAVFSFYAIERPFLNLKRKFGSLVSDSPDSRSNITVDFSDNSSYPKDSPLTFSKKQAG